MTPEEAQKLLDGTSPGPWEHSNPDGITEISASGNAIATDANPKDAPLIVAAPGMAAMIANMRTEYAVEYQPNPDPEWYRVSDWSEEYPLVEGEELNPRERIVKRYVTAPQPLGDEQ